ncbi:MAG TPA: gliding motility protein GldL [Flavobacteriaceae bacterium]|nr:gliding motility protein GldL [Flavobacteriaceae bacterium]
MRLPKRLFNMAYGIGASIVILGALFKILHWSIGPISGDSLLAFGLITEATIFFLSAFEPVDSDLDWSLVYPELAGGQGSAMQRGGKQQMISQEEESGLLSKKLDAMLKDAKIDANLMASLGESIRSFEGAAKGIAPTTDAMTSTKKYSEEMVKAATQLESLNSLYKVQLESSKKQAEANESVANNAVQLQQQMESLATNLSSLNGVYGGMLSAMTRK